MCLECIAFGTLSLSLICDFSKELRSLIKPFLRWPDVLLSIATISSPAGAKRARFALGPVFGRWDSLCKATGRKRFTISATTSTVFLAFFIVLPALTLATWKREVRFFASVYAHSWRAKNFMALEVRGYSYTDYISELHFPAAYTLAVYVPLFLPTISLLITGFIWDAKCYFLRLRLSRVCVISSVREVQP